MVQSITRRARVSYYLAWLPMTALLGVVLSKQGSDWLEASGLAIGLCLPFSVVGGASYYMCKAMPLRRAKIFQVLPSLLTTSAVASLVWVGWSRLLGMIIGGQTEIIISNQSIVLFGLGVAFFALTLAFHYLVIALRDINRAERRSNEAQLLKREAELRALRAQIDPHFLFNSLNSIAALTVIDSQKAGEMCRLLSDFLRTSLQIGDMRSVSLEKEVALAGKYLSIEQVRFEDRMDFVPKLTPGCQKTSVPPLLLQPLVENAVKHGIAELTEKSTIDLVAHDSEDFCRISVSNNYDIDGPSKSSKGRGLKITAERLLAFYGEAATMVVKKDSGLFEVVLTIPNTKMS